VKFRTRLIVAMSLALGATLSVSFTAVSLVVEQSEERQLDEALRAEAHEETMEIASRRPFEVRIRERTGADADDLGRLPTFAALFDDGKLVDRTPGFRGGDPEALDPSRHPIGVPFDVTVGGEHIRALFLHVPEHHDVLLLMGATRAELEKDARFLREVMTVAGFVSILFAILVSYSIARGLTRDHAAIAQAARRVARGELDARVSIKTSDAETAQLAQDIDRMIDRLETLVGSQQRFVAHAAHELRSPLTALYGELQLALRRDRTPEEYKDAIGQAIGAAKRLIALAEDLLALARLGADADGKKHEEEVDARAIVESAIAWAQGGATTRNVTFDVEGESATIVGRRIDLERMVRNLVDNAVRHGPEGSKVRIELRPRGDVLDIEVTDGGPGVRDEDRDRVFEPFFRSDGVRSDDSGSGLGLSIAREIARAHGGEVVLADREEGAGARFVATVSRTMRTA
jgi:two-component system OmpR family sensor kinase